MKIGCISWSYRNDYPDGLDLLRWMEHCKKDCRLDGVELWNNHVKSLDAQYLKSIKSKADELGLEIYSVATKCLFGDFSPKEIEAAKQTLRDWLAATNALGAPVLRVSIGGSELRDPAHQTTVFRSLADVVEENTYPHIRVGIENQEPGVIQDVADTKKMVAETGGRIGLVLDNGSLINKQDSYEFTKKTLPYAVVVHLKFFDINPDGSDKVLDYAKIAPILKDSDYDSFVSIEYDSEEPGQKDVPVIASYLRTLLG